MQLSAGLSRRGRRGDDNLFVSETSRPIIGAYSRVVGTRAAGRIWMKVRNEGMGAEMGEGKRGTAIRPNQPPTLLASCHPALVLPLAT